MYYMCLKQENMTLNTEDVEQSNHCATVTHATMTQKVINKSQDDVTSHWKTCPGISQKNKCAFTG